MALQSNNPAHLEIVHVYYHDENVAFESELPRHIIVQHMPIWTETFRRGSIKESLSFIKDEVNGYVEDEYGYEGVPDPRTDRKFCVLLYLARYGPGNDEDGEGEEGGMQSYKLWLVTDRWLEASLALVAKDPGTYMLSVVCGQADHLRIYKDWEATQYLRQTGQLKAGGMKVLRWPSTEAHSIKCEEDVSDEADVAKTMGGVVED